jgi:hypothetical protein
MIDIPRAPQASSDRSVEILDLVVSQLAQDGETPLQVLAESIGSQPRNLERALDLHNLRLLSIGHPFRIRSRVERRVRFWRLEAAPQR